VALCSCRCWGRRASRVRDARPARAGDPDVPVVLPAVQVSVPLMFRDEGHQGVERVRHGAGDYHTSERRQVRRVSRSCHWDSNARDADIT
jgi:hypothetical protein